MNQEEGDGCLTCPPCSLRVDPRSTARPVHRAGGTDAAAAAESLGEADQQRLPGAAQAAAPLHSAGIRLRADDRAAQPRAARVSEVEEHQGLADAGVFFHYFRISAENRILWGGCVVEP